MKKMIALILVITMTMTSLGMNVVAADTSVVNDVSSPSATSVTNNSFAALSNNLLNVDNLISHTAVLPDGEGSKTVSVSYSSTDTADHMFDDSASSKCDINVDVQANSKWICYWLGTSASTGAAKYWSGDTSANPNKEYYVEFVFDLKETIIPTSALYAVAHSNYSAYHYEVFGGMSESSLFDSCLAEVNTMANLGKVTTTTFSNQQPIRYYGIRVYHYGAANGTNDKSFRLAEIQLSGEKYEVLNSTSVTNDTFNALSNNLLSANGLIGCSVILPHDDGTKVEPVQYSAVANLFDNSATNKCDIDMSNQSNGQYMGYWLGLQKSGDTFVYCSGDTSVNLAKEYYVEFKFKLDDVIVPTSALYAVSNSSYSAYHYELFGSMSESTLFDNRLARVNTMTNPGTVTTTTFFEQEPIQYYGIRVYHFGATGKLDQSFRLGELQLTGTAYTEPDVPSEPEELSVTYGGSDTVTAYEGLNYLKDATKSVYTRFPKAVAIQNESVVVTDATIQESTSLSGGDIGNEGFYDGVLGDKAPVDLDFTSGGGVLNSTAYSQYNSEHTYYAQFTFELDTPINADGAEFGVAFRTGKTDYSGFKYQVYVSDAEDTLWNNDLGTNSNENRMYTATFNGDGAIRYLGIRIYSFTSLVNTISSADVLRTTEWWLTGTEYVEPEEPDVPEEPSAENVTNNTFNAVSNNLLNENNFISCTAVLPSGDSTVTSDMVYSVNAPKERLFDGVNGSSNKADIELHSLFNEHKIGYWLGTVLSEGNYTYCSGTNVNPVKEYYVEFKFKLDYAMVPTKAIYAVAHSNYSAYHYEVFGGMSEDTLFDNSLTEVDTVTGAKGTVTTTTFSDQEPIQYYAIRVYHFGATGVTDGSFRLGELQLAGRSGDFTYDADDENVLVGYVEGSKEVDVPSNITSFDIADNNYITQEVERLYVWGNSTDISGAFADDFDYAALTIISARNSSAWTFAKEKGCWIEYLSDDDALENDYNDDTVVNVADLVRLMRYENNPQVRPLKQALKCDVWTDGYMEIYIEQLRDALAGVTIADTFAELKTYTTLEDDWAKESTNYKADSTLNLEEHGYSAEEFWDETIKATKIEGYMPNYKPLANVMKKAAAGEKITVAVISDSMGAGAGEATRTWVNDYFEGWFKEKFGTDKVEFMNKSVGSNTLRQINWRATEDLTFNGSMPDVVAVTCWSFHDSTYDAYALESLLYRLAYKQNVAVIGTVIPAYCSGKDTKDTAYYEGMGNSQGGTFGVVTPAVPRLQELFKYYRIPVISLSNALDTMEDEFENVKFGFSRFAYRDALHPSVFGATIIGVSLCDELNFVAEHQETILNGADSGIPTEPSVQNGWCYVNAELWGNSDIEATGTYTDLAFDGEIRTWNGWQIEDGNSISFTLSNVEILELFFNIAPSNGAAAVTITNASGVTVATGSLNKATSSITAWNTGVCDGDTKPNGSLLFGNKETVTLTITASEGPVKLLALGVVEANAGN